MLNTGFWQFWSSKIIGDSAFFLGPMKIRFKSWEYARISIQPSYLPFVRLTAWGYNAHRSGFVFHSQQPMSWVSEAQAGDMESMFQGKMLTVSKPWDRTRECMPNVVPTSNGWVNVSYWKLYPCLKTQSLSAMFCLNLAVLFFALGQKTMPTGAAYCELEKTHLAPSGKEMLVENMSGVQLTKSFIALYQWWPMFGDYGFRKNSNDPTENDSTSRLVNDCSWPMHWGEAPKNHPFSLFFSYMSNGWLQDFWYRAGGTPGAPGVKDYGLMSFSQWCSWQWVWIALKFAQSQTVNNSFLYLEILEINTNINRNISIQI